MMKSNHQPEDLEFKPAAKPVAKVKAQSKVTMDANDALKALPMAELEKKLKSSPGALSQAEGQKRLLHSVQADIGRCLLPKQYCSGPGNLVCRASVS